MCMHVEGRAGILKFMGASKWKDFLKSNILIFRVGELKNPGRAGRGHMLGIHFVAASVY